MPDQTPDPDYVPRPTSSSTGEAAVVALVLLLLVLGGGGGFMALRFLMAPSAPPATATSIQLQPTLVPAPEIAPLPIEPGNEQEQPDTTPPPQS